MKKSSHFRIKFINCGPLDRNKVARTSHRTTHHPEY